MRGDFGMPDERVVDVVGNAGPEVAADRWMALPKAELADRKAMAVFPGRRFVEID